MPDREERCEAYRQKAVHEFDVLVERGVVMGGNAFSPVLLAKGALDGADREGGLLSGADGDALRSALVKTLNDGKRISL